MKSLGLHGPVIVGCLFGSLANAPALAQPEHRAEAPASIEQIDREFESGLAALERQRLQRLAALAAAQAGSEANAAYEAYFQRALDARLYRDAEPIAGRILRQGQSASPQVVYLAEAVDILAKVERGDFRPAVESLEAALQAGKAEGRPAAPALPVATRLALLELIFEKLVGHDQFALAREAFELISQHAQQPAVRDYATARLRRLDRIGKPAPGLVGTDLDGKTVRLDDARGQVVLLIFWASWCVPSAQEVEQFERLYASHRDRGLRVLGINLDTAQDGGQPVETVLPNIRRFVLDHNIPWPTLINGDGERDYAKTYGITDIPANVLIGRDGTVIGLDLDRSNLRRKIEQALGG